MQDQPNTVELGQYRLDCYVAGGVPPTEVELVAQGRVRSHFFDSRVTAIKEWLGVCWSYERDEETRDVLDMLMSEAGIVVDRYTGRIVAVVAFRWDDSGESRLPVAMVVNVAGDGRMFTVRVEDDWPNECPDDE